MSKQVLEHRATFTFHFSTQDVLQVAFKTNKKRASHLAEIQYVMLYFKENTSTCGQ